MCRLSAALAISYVALALGGQSDNFLGASAASDAEAEISERRFWQAQWHTLEGELLQLSSTLKATPANATKGANATKEVKPAAKKEETPAAKKEEKPAAKAPNVTSAKVQVDVHNDIQDKLKEVKALTKGKMNKMMLQPMLGMLKGLYEDQKTRIGELNKKEGESKKRFAGQQAAFDKKIQGIKDKVEHHKFDAEFGANQTRDYTRQFKYWEGVRARDHKQFHNALKITHSLMAKEKDTIKQYEVALATKDPEDNAHDKFMKGIMNTLSAHKKEDKAHEAVSQDVPEVVLLQFCQDALTEVHRELGVLAL